MATETMTRRDFMGSGFSLAAGTILGCRTTRAHDQNDSQAHWREMLEDPVRGMIKGTPSLEVIRALFAPLAGRPAFEPALIAENIRKLQTMPAVDT